MQPVSTQRSPQCINPERAARVHKDSIVAAETPCKEDSSQVSSSQAHILNALRLMGCKEHENSVQRLRPNIDARCHVLHVTETDIQATAMKSIKSLTRQSIAGPATDEIEIDDKDHVPSVATSIDHDIATMYKVYSEKYKDAMPGKPPIGRTLFYSIAKTSPKGRCQGTRGSCRAVPFTSRAGRSAVQDIPGTVKEMVAQLNMFDVPAIQRTVASESNIATTTHQVLSLDLAPHRKPNKTSRLVVTLSVVPAVLFYDRLRRVCIAIVDEDPIRLAEVADILLTIHQCEHRTYRYFMLAAQQAHHMRLAIAQMNSRYCLYGLQL
ncbi:hypothetical protein EMCRGX_G027321 [Ephydatia muelleri]